MGNKNKFWKGILFGAIAGGAVALLDKETRHSVIEDIKKGTKEVTHFITHPSEVAEQLRTKTEKLRNTVEQVSEDVTFIAEKVGELKEVTPAVVSLVSDTKEAFLESSDD